MVKLKKSQLKELIRQAIVEDIMDKEIKNAKTGNKIKVRTALQLPGDHPANKMAKKLVAKSPIKKDKKGDDAGGPAYSNVPKGAKSSKQAKVMKQNDATAEKINPNLSNSKDLVMRGMADDIDEFMNEIPDEGQDFDKADELLNLVRDNEQGMRDDDDDMIDDYKKGILKVLNTPGKSKNESIKESKGRRCTVKEVQKWMKGLEENRYKKTYNSDCRRVSWMVNNEGVELTEMPTSMRKKWSKAEYGRERHLAKEFTKHLNSNQLQEQKLRKVIRKIIKEQINENNISDINKFWSKNVKLTSPEGKSMKKENAKLIKLLNNEIKKLGIKAKFKETLRFTGAYTKVDGKQIFVRFTGPQGSKIQVVGGKEIKLKPNTTIKNIAATIVMATTL